MIDTKIYNFVIHIIFVSHSVVILNFVLVLDNPALAKERDTLKVSYANSFNTGSADRQGRRGFRHLHCGAVYYAR